MFALLHAAQVWAASCNITQKPKPDHRSRSSVATDGDADAASDSGYSSDSSTYGSSPASADSSGILNGDMLNGSSSNRSTEKQQQSPASTRTYRRSNEELQQGPAGNGNGSDAAAAAGAGAGPAAAAEPLLVEVDVVAHEGLTWIEVKNQVREAAHNCSVHPLLCNMPWLLNAAACCTRCAETAHKSSPAISCHEITKHACCLIMYCVSKQEWFGLDSVHWMGSSHAKGLAQQVQALQAVAAAPVNSRRWRCPEVVVYFPSEVSREVAGALRDMGVVVADGPGGCMYASWWCVQYRAACQRDQSLILLGQAVPITVFTAAVDATAGSIAALPVPQPPSVTNLDATSLCALVSEVSWGDPHSPQLQAWAARTVHWRVSVWQFAVWRGASTGGDGWTLKACL
jgi:hypothetical protein